jgi:hypothetical protein
MMVEIPVRLAMQPAVRSQVPTKEDRPLQVDDERMRAAVLGVAPIQLIVVGTTAEGEEQPHWGVAVSITRLGRLLDAVLGRLVADPEMPDTEVYKDGRIVGAPDGEGAFAIRKNTYMVAERVALLHAWLDGIQADAERAEQDEPVPTPLPAGMDPQLLAAYDGLDRSSPVRFACLNTHGEIGALLRKLPGKEAAEQLRQASLDGPGVQSISGQLQSMNSRDASLTLRVSCADGGTAARIEAALIDLAGDEQRTPYLRDAVVQQQAGHLVELTGRIENLPDRVAALVNEKAQEESPASPGAVQPIPPSP